MIRILLVCALLASTYCLGQKYSFITYSTEEGLPQSQVSAITQDKEGYLWIGTIGGLTKFNGGEFVPYTSKEGLLNNRITSLNYFDETIWVGHDGGISYIKNKTVRSVKFTGEDKSRPVHKILRFKGRLLVCSNGGGLFELRNEKLVKIELGGPNLDRVRAGYVHAEVLYLATKEGILTTSDLKTFRILKELGTHSFSGVTGNSKELIFTTYDSLLLRKNLATSKVVVSSPSHTNSWYGCYLDSDGTLWLYAKEGLVRIDKDGNQFILDEKSGLPLNTISCVYQDKNKNIWIGSQGKGVFRFPGLRFNYYDQSSGYLSDLFMGGFQKKNGDFYFGTFDRGIIYRQGNGKTRLVDIGKPNATVWGCIEEVDGKDWFGTHSSLVSVDRSGRVTVFEQDKYPGLPGTKIVSFERINSTSMYVGGNEGVSLYRNGVFTRLGNQDVEFLGTVRDMEIVNGELYCVSNLGLFIYKNGNFKQIKGIDQVIYNIVTDDYGTVWLGSEGGLYTLKNGTVQHQVKLLNDDPRANFINFLNYRNGSIYVGTNNGVFILSELNREIKIARFGVEDGIPDLETNLNSSFFDNRGNFWFGTSSGLVCFHPDIPGSSAHQPSVNLKNILLNYEPFNYKTYSSKLNEDGLPEQLVLPYNKNNLIFELDGVSLVNHRYLKYQFLLEGLSEGWSPLTSVSTITFTNLPAGEYTLKLRVVDLDGRTSDMIEIPFIIRQAFYKTWWFVLLCIIALALLIVAAFRMRIRRIQQLNENEMLTYKTRLLALEQKSLNASMNRHFIFNALNSIQYFINTRDRVSANKYLTNFAQLIRKNLDSATWEDNRISLDEEVARIRLYLSLESMRFKDRFVYEIRSEGIDLESIKIPAMIMQPFIENSIIHGILPKEEVLGRIDIDMKIEGNILEISIKDNGIGVHQSLSKKNHDMGDHRSQGMEITSKRIELLQKVSNQSMELIGPEEIVGEDGSINGTYVLLKLYVENLED